MRNNGHPVEYTFFMQMDTTPYAGEWIAIKGEKVIVHDKDLKKVMKRLAKLGLDGSNGGERATLTKIPEKHISAMCV